MITLDALMPFWLTQFKLPAGGLVQCNLDSLGSELQSVCGGAILLSLLISCIIKGIPALCRSRLFSHAAVGRRLA